MPQKEKHTYKDRKYSVVPYDPQWSEQYQEYVQKIRTIFGELRTEHIGSTSVTGMVGKNCIDVLVLVDDLRTVEDHVDDMAQARFEYAGEFVMPDSRLFRVMRDRTLIANIHFFPPPHAHVAEMLALRDYLRSHPEEVKAYSKLKIDLYKNYPDDYASYRKHQDKYMDGLKNRAATPGS